jgi:hypothetical protein
MSALLQMPCIWASADMDQDPQVVLDHDLLATTEPAPDPNFPCSAEAVDADPDEPLPEISLAFYRKHTEKMLRRYLYASMLVGRTPAILGDPVSRGLVSNRRIKTFEDAVIFVLDIERCLEKLRALDRALLSRIVLQEYTHGEAASLLGISIRSVSSKYPIALDRLTKLLLADGLLIVSQS